MSGKNRDKLENKTPREKTEVIPTISTKIVDWGASAMVRPRRNAGVNI